MDTKLLNITSQRTRYVYGHSFIWSHSILKCSVAVVFRAIGYLCFVGDFGFGHNGIMPWRLPTLPNHQYTC